MRLAGPVVLMLGLVLTACGGGEPGGTAGEFACGVNETNAGGLDTSIAHAAYFHRYWNTGDPAQANPRLRDKIDDVVADSLCADGPGAAGLAIAVVDGDRLAHVKGYGYADLDQKTPVQAARTRFRWASLSKVVTAIAALVARRRHSLQGGGAAADLLDTPVTQWVSASPLAGQAIELPATYWHQTIPECDPSPPPQGDGWEACGMVAAPLERLPPQVTLRRLLGHTAGIRHYENGAPRYVEPVPAFGRQVGDAVTVVPSDDWRAVYHDASFGMFLPLWIQQPLRYRPGERFAYSSMGFNLAGRVVEAVTGRGLFSFVDRFIGRRIHPGYAMATLHPDDLYDPRFQGSPYFTPRYRSQGYSRTASGQLRKIALDSIAWKEPAAGYIGSALDLGLLCWGMINRSDILPDRAWEDMFTEQRTVDGRGIGYGLGVGVGLRQGRRQVLHLGAQPGAAAAVVAYPGWNDEVINMSRGDTHRLCIGVLANTQEFDAEALAYRIEDVVRNGTTSPRGHAVAPGVPAGPTEPTALERVPVRALD